MKRVIILSFAFSIMLALPGFALAEDFFSQTELQLHADLNRQPIDAAIWTATLEHVSEWSYGDNFLFLDIEGQKDLKTQADTLYFEYAPRLSMDRIFKKKILPLAFLGETYATVQYNDSDKNYINQVWLYGVSVDFDFQPNYGYSNLHLLVRDEETQDTAYQLTFAWGQPFKLAGLDCEFKGFADFWKNNDTHVFLTEPQLRLNLSSFVGENHILSKATVGTELEFSHNFFSSTYGWEFNPTLFIAVTF